MSKILKIASDTCAPCKRMKSIEEEVLKDFPDVKLEVVNISTKDGMDKAHDLGVRAVPTYIFTNSNGLTVNITSGMMDKEIFKGLVESI